MKMIKRKKLWACGLAAVLLVAASVLYVSNQAAEADVAAVQKGTIKNYVEEIGTVRCTELRNASIEGSGLIEAIPVDVGQGVKKGDLLLTLEKTELETQLKTQDEKIREIEATFQGRSDVKNYASSVEKARLAIGAAEDACALAQDDYDYAKLLEERGALSAKDLKAKEAALKSAQAQMESAKIDLQQLTANTPESAKAVYQAQLEQAVLGRESLSRSLQKQEVRAPMDGVVLEKKVEPGTVGAPGTVAFVIGNVGHLEVEAYILADDAAEIETGDEVEITERTEQRQSVAGRVSKIAPSAVEVTSSLGVNQKKVQVTIEPSEPLPQVKQGYEVDVRIVTETKDDALTVPLSAVFDDQESSCVFVVQDGKTVLRKVKKGIGDQESVEITDGLKEGETVLTEPDLNIKEGMKIKPSQPGA